MLVDEESVEVRFLVGLPAAGRRVLGREAEDLLVRRLPEAVHASLLYENVDGDAVTRHVLAAEDADSLRGMLDEAGLVAFVADDSILPRKSGVEAGPLAGGIPFRSPETLRREFTLPNRGRVVGMGVPKGVTLIVGGGFHGKSTLLRALERGVYNHVPGDGRELVVTEPDGGKDQGGGWSECGWARTYRRSYWSLPGGLDTRKFSTLNASGATSQAANIIEALESGCRVLLLDEDSSATNFMIRDRRMEALIEKRHEPITPFLDRVRQMYTEHGVSTVLVMGGSGDYFEAADTVISMVEYVPVDSTKEAREVARAYPTGRKGATGGRVRAIIEKEASCGVVECGEGSEIVIYAASGVEDVNLRGERHRSNGSGAASGARAGGGYRSGHGGKGEDQWGGCEGYHR